MDFKEVKTFMTNVPMQRKLIGCGYNASSHVMVFCVTAGDKVSVVAEKSLVMPARGDQLQLEGGNLFF